MNILKIGIESLQWQGGTIWQVIAECHKKANKKSDCYRYGVQSAKQFPSEGIFGTKVPVNSWNNEFQCNIDYIAGWCAQLGF